MDSGFPPCKMSPCLVVQGHYMHHLLGPRYIGQQLFFSVAKIKQMMSCARILILLLLIVLVMLTACDARNVTPDMIFRRERVAFADVRKAALETPPSQKPLDIPEYVPSDHFEGCRPHYVFTTRDEKLGYHRDRPAFPDDENLCEFEYKYTD